jgi:RNA polymerase sigma-70 factor, ECF subfamily
MNASPFNTPSNGNGRSVTSPNGGDGQAAVMPSGRYGDGNGDGGSTLSGPVPGAGAEGRTDEQLLSDYRHGDKTAFSDLVQRYQRELYHFLVRFLGNRASAEDVFQETFLQVHQSADQFDLQRRFRPWLFTIAANKARDLIRSQARRPANPLQATISPGDEESGEFIDLMQSANETPDEPMEKQELQQQVQKAVTGMPEHLREILLLSYFHQFPYKQISEILDIPLGTVKSRLHAAVAHFADRWKGMAEAQERPGQAREGTSDRGDANPRTPTA